MPLFNHMNVAPDQTIARNFALVFRLSIFDFFLDLVNFLVGGNELELFLDTFIGTKQSESEREEEHDDCHHRQEVEPHDFVVHYLGRLRSHPELVKMCWAFLDFSLS